MKLLLFENVHMVMRAEGILKGANVGCELLPTPKEYSSECGMCLAVQEEPLQLIEDLLKDIHPAVVERPGVTS